MKTGTNSSQPKLLHLRRVCSVPFLAISVAFGWSTMLFGGLANMISGAESIEIGPLKFQRTSTKPY